MNALKSRQIAQVKGIRFELSVVCPIRWSAAIVWNASMHPAQNRETAMMGVTTSRLVRKCTRARTAVKIAVQKALHSRIV